MINLDHVNHYSCRHNIYTRIENSSNSLGVSLPGLLICSATSCVISAIKLFRFHEKSRWQDFQIVPFCTRARSPYRTAKTPLNTAIAPITYRCQTSYAVMTLAGDVYQRVISQAQQMVMASSLKGITKMLGQSRWYSHFTDCGLIIGKFVSSLRVFKDCLTAP